MRFVFAVVVVALASQAWPQTLVQSPPPRVQASAQDLLRAQQMAEQARRLLMAPASKPRWVHGQPQR